MSFLCLGLNHSSALSYEAKYDLSFLSDKEKVVIQTYLNSNKNIDEVNKLVQDHATLTIKKFNNLLINENKEMSKKNLLLINWPNEDQLILQVGEKIIRDLK